MDLIKLITEKLTEIESSGKIDEIIEKHVIKCVDDIVADSFRWSGEGKESIKKALEGKLGIAIEQVKISQYNKLVSDIVNKQLNNTMIKDLQADIQETVNNLTGILEQKEWKLSEIIAKFIDSLDKSYDGFMDNERGEISLYVDKDRDWCHIRFDKETNKKYYLCDNTLFLYKGRLSSVTIEETPFSPFHSESMNDFERFMFTLYCNNVTITLDEEDCELSYYMEDYD